MNSIISDDLSRDFATETATFIDIFYVRSQNITSLHKELLEINFSIAAYIEESKRRLEGLRLELALQANGSQRVVEILSEKCKIQRKMSNLPATPGKRNIRTIIKSLQEDNNNTSNKFSERLQARTFMQWYKHMVDNERQNLALYLSDDVMLDWFGRTIKSRKKVAWFLKNDMQCSKHDFTTVESIEKIQSRQERLQRPDDTILASPLHSPEIVKPKTERPGKRRLLRSNCNSPEWAEGCKPDDEFTSSERKRLKTSHTESLVEQNHELNHHKILFLGDETSDIGNKGDGKGMLGRRTKRKYVPVTPPNREVGQGDCLPSTSGTDANRSHDALNAQLPKLAVECNGYIEFTRTRNNRSMDSMKWERKCKIQISYSEDPLNVGEYIIWALLYTDESKCRRNLLAEFEAVAKEEDKKV